MLRILSVAIISLFTSVPALAIQGGYVGGGLGFADITLDEYEASLSLAARGGLVFSDNFTAGIGLTSYSEEFSSGGAKAEISIIPFFIEGNYHFLTNTEGFYVGGRVAIVRETMTLTILGAEFEESESETGIGIQGGYTYPLKEQHTIGFEVTFMSVMADPKDYELYSGTALYNFWF